MLQSRDVPDILKPLALLEEGPHLALVQDAFAAEGLDAVLALTVFAPSKEPTMTAQATKPDELPCRVRAGRRG